jgi:hypothetical protein
VFLTSAFKDGFFEVQDAGSQKIGEFLDVKPGMRVVDACAEPYGISWKSDPVCDGTSELPFSFRKECIPVDVG